MKSSMKIRSRERGVVMIVALIVLVVMTLAGLAMLRQLDSGSAIAGNLAFKQGATAGADFGIEQAHLWLTDPTHVALLTSDNPAQGYFATWGTNVDPTSSDWALNIWGVVTNGQQDLVTNDRVKYVIHRLCSLPGATDIPGQQCSATSGVCPDKSGSGCAFTPPSQPYYRITAQVSGARNTVSYTQVVLGSP
jgi:type IV pilus assembly protein PilX